MYTGLTGLNFKRNSYDITTTLDASYPTCLFCLYNGGVHFDNSVLIMLLLYLLKC